MFGLVIVIMVLLLTVLIYANRLAMNAAIQQLELVARDTADEAQLDNTAVGPGQFPVPVRSVRGGAHATCRWRD